MVIVLHKMVFLHWENQLEQLVVMDASTPLNPSACKMSGEKDFSAERKIHRHKLIVIFETGLNFMGNFLSGGVSLKPW